MTDLLPAPSVCPQTSYFLLHIDIIPDLERMTIHGDCDGLRQSKLSKIDL